MLGDCGFATVPRCALHATYFCRFRFRHFSPFVLEYQYDLLSFQQLSPPLFGFTGCTKCKAKGRGIANKLHSEMVSGSNISCEMETCSSNEFVEQIYADIMAEGPGKIGSAGNDS